MHRTHRRLRLSAAAGFSLIELMIGMALGLLSVLIITQVMSLFEAQRRTTTGSADAQTNGGIALHTIARDVQQAGYGLLPATDSALECATATTTFGGMGITGLSPISITNGVAASGVNASDSITIRYATSPMTGAVSQITTDLGSNQYAVRSNLGCQVGDVTLISNGTQCAMSTATAVSSTPSITLANNTLASPGTSTNIACLGAWIEVTYAVNQATGNLDRTVRVDGVSNGTTVKGVVTGTTPSVVGVVNLQVQYGVSAAANSNQVTQWVNASAPWDAPSVSNRNRIKAVRVAVIARNPKIETTAVTAACSSTTAAAPTGLCAWEGTAASPAPAVDLSPADANWNRYRYRVFETIIPLRNMIWARDTL